MRVLLLILTLMPALARAQEACRQALVFALDVSGSVNAQEFRDQVDGLAAALGSPEVRDLILTGTETPVVLAAFEWSSRNHQHVILPWTRITDAAALDRVIARIAAHRPVRAGLKTAMGQALLFAAEMLSGQAHCWTQTIDVSGDGRNNIGPVPRQAYELPQFSGVNVNALVIGQPDRDAATSTRPSLSREELRAYFETQVIKGPNSFAIVARGYADYARAMREKLLLELELPVFGALSFPGRN